MLSLDAALGACSVALVEDGISLGLRHGSDSRSATASLPGLVQDLLVTHGWRFDAVAVTVGPGGFTGLRGALALAHGLALGEGAPVVGVTVVEALLADNVDSVDGVRWVALDSRRAGRVFLCRGGAIEAIGLDAIDAPGHKVTVLGDAADLVVDRLRQAGVDARAAGSRAVDVAAVARVAMRRLAGDLPPSPAQPIYVEQPEARATTSQRPAPN